MKGTNIDIYNILKRVIWTILDPKHKTCKFSSHITKLLDYRALSFAFKRILFRVYWLFNRPWTFEYYVNFATLWIINFASYRRWRPKNILFLSKVRKKTFSIYKNVKVSKIIPTLLNNCLVIIFICFSATGSWKHVVHCKLTFPFATFSLDFFACVN